MEKIFDGLIQKRLLARTLSAMKISIQFERLSVNYI